MQRVEFEASSEDVGIMVEFFTGVYASEAVPIQGISAKAWYMRPDLDLTSLGPIFEAVLEDTPCPLLSLEPTVCTFQGATYGTWQMNCPHSVASQSFQLTVGNTIASELHRRIDLQPRPAQAGRGFAESLIDPLSLDQEELLEPLALAMEEGVVAVAKVRHPNVC